MTSQKPILQSTSSLSKSYSYTLGTVKLEFTLRTDIKEQMKEFLVILARASEDITNDLKPVS